MSEGQNWHRGDWMQTYTGRQFFPAAPSPDDVDPIDIAHALSHLCRYAGHVDRFYSVAEHCVLMSRWIAVEYAHDPELALHLAREALLHDATEAYVVDVPRPLKLQLPEYVAIESRVAVAIARRFGHQPIVQLADDLFKVAEAIEVKGADTRILLDERAALMSQTRHAWAIEDWEPLGVEVEGWPPAHAEWEYLNRLEELGVLS